MCALKKHKKGIVLLRKRKRLNWSIKKGTIKEEYKQEVSTFAIFSYEHILIYLATPHFYLNLLLLNICQCCETSKQIG